VKKILLFIFVSTLCIAAAAQDSTSSRSSRSDRKAEKRQRINALIKSEEEGNLSFRKQKSFGIELRTNGYGGFFEIGKRRSPRFTTIYGIEITEIKNNKEEKLDGVQNLFTNSYVYGKENNFYQTKLGFGQQYILGQKGNKNGVAILASLSGGLSLGLLKPYMLDVKDSIGRTKTITYKDDPAIFLSQGNIIGGAGLTHGWNELKVKPGVFVKSALRFDFGRYNESIQALEIGMSVETYAGKIPILVYNESKQVFFQGHIAFVFGSRKK
jgi:hypothetical protein